MSLTSIMNIGTSGLMTAQVGLRTTSDNIANVNTPGYIRKLVDQNSLAFNGAGAGVDASRVRLAFDRFLQSASLTSAAEAGRAGAVSDLFDRAQSYFGDPGSETGFFGRLDDIFASFQTLTDDAASAPRRQEAVTKTARFFEEASRISAGLQAVRTEADARISSAVERANQLIEQIETLNVEISRATAGGRDASGAEGVQAQLVDQLAGLIDIKIHPREFGGVNLKTPDGLMLAGDGAAKLSYTRSGDTSSGAAYQDVFITPARGAKQALLDHVRSGEIKGLIELRDREVPAVAERLGEFVAQAADALNRAHNASSAVPAPARLSGRDTGLGLPAAVTGFTGRTSVAITGADGRIQRRVDIDFDARTMTVDGGAATAFTPASFANSLDTALGAFGSASFTDGVLQLDAAAGAGVAIADDATAPSQKNGRGFSHFFGLNDLVRSESIGFYETGLRPASQHGFPAGQTITLRLTDANGVRLRDVPVAVPAGGTMANMVAALNAADGGVGLYGAFALDAQGRLAFTPSGSPPVTLSVANDETARGGAGGVSMSELFGIGAAARAGRADDFSVRADIYADPKKLALAKLDLSVAAGQPALAIGDTRGALALAAAGETTLAFDALGGSGGSSMTLSRYSAEFSGALGAKAQAAAERMEAAQAIAEEAAGRRAGAEGVNLDEELVKLTTYQQAFNASSRLIQAAKDMYDILLGMT